MTNENENENENSITSEPIKPTVQKESPLVTIGQLLKEKRVEKDLSLKVISQQTKIHIGLLEHLEANRFDKLPSKTYVRGFVKMTCKILEIEQEYALKLLDLGYQPNEAQNSGHLDKALVKYEEKEVAKSAPTKVVSFPTHNNFKTITPSSAILIAKFFTLLLSLGVVIFSVKTFIDKPTTTTEVKLPKVLTSINQKGHMSPRPPVKSIKLEVASTKPPEPIQVNLIQDKNQKVNVTVNNIHLQTISLGEKQFIDEDMPKEKYDELLPAKFRINPTKGTEVIFLNASEGDSWLTYKIDDKDIKKFVLRQGRTLFLRGAIIRLFIGNTRSLKAFYNNKPIDLSANNKSGIRNIVLPEELKTKYMAPLFIFQNDGSAITSDDFLEANKNKEKEKTLPNPI